LPYNTPAVIRSEKKMVVESARLQENRAAVLVDSTRNSDRTTSSTSSGIPEVSTSIIEKLPHITVVTRRTNTDSSNDSAPYEVPSTPVIATMLLDIGKPRNTLVEKECTEHGTVSRGDVFDRNEEIIMGHADLDGEDSGGIRHLQTQESNSRGSSFIGGKAEDGARTGTEMYASVETDQKLDAQEEVKDMQWYPRGENFNGGKAVIPSHSFLDPGFSRLSASAHSGVYHYGVSKSRVKLRPFYCTRRGRVEVG
jgi:hypothetical protein